jgi:proline iminopeptidase
VRDQLASITAPTLIVCGTDDFICGPPAADLMARGIANSRVAMIENCGHMMFIEQPAAFRDAVATFLARG